jgi:adenine-specific DNA-methyltransferase
MQGIRLLKGTPSYVTPALPLLTLNSVTMFGAKIFGRSYGGGVLKREPREAAVLGNRSPSL